MFLGAENMRLIVCWNPLVFLRIYRFQGRTSIKNNLHKVLKCLNNMANKWTKCSKDLFKSLPSKKCLLSLVYLVDDLLIISIIKIVVN